MALLETIQMENAVSKPLDGEEASSFSASASCPEDSRDEWSSSLLTCNILRRRYGYTGRSEKREELYDVSVSYPDTTASEPA